MLVLVLGAFPKHSVTSPPLDSRHFCTPVVLFPLDFKDEQNLKGNPSNVANLLYFS